ncbi:MAG: protein kinase domain-containing protein [Gemmatimonadaceae bacterium]
MLTVASRGLSLTTRIFGSTAAVVAAVLGVTLFFTSRQAARTADATVNRALAQASSQIASQLDARRRELQGQSETFAKDPDFRALVQSNARPGDLLDQVIEAQERIGADWAQATDAGGVLLAKSDDPSAQPMDLSESALIAGALGGVAAHGFGREPAPRGLFQATAVPVTVPTGDRERVVGTLMVVRGIDEAFAQSVKSASSESIDVAFFALDSAGPRLVANTIGAGDDVRRAITSIEWPAAPDSAGAPAPMRTTVRILGEQYVALGAPLRAASGSLVGGMLVLKDRDREFAAFRQLTRVIIAWGTVGLALAGLLAFGIARQITRPVRALVAATRRAADGDYSADIAVTAEGEIGALADAFRAMLADLRSKQALVDYLGHGSNEAQTVMLAAGASSTMARQAMEGRVRPGTTFANRYEVKELLGAGGMGLVFRAMDAELGEVIALKTLKKSLLDQDPSALDRFKSEIRLARRISHRNVVRTHDIGEYSGEYYITMEYVEGRSLKELIRARGRLPVAVTLTVGKQLCRALEVAHAAGVIHRDVKPQNMVVQSDGVLKVMDFGIARMATGQGGMTRAGMIVGTPEYMSPEQLMGDELDGRADLYAMGCVLYECLVGQPPITAESAITIIAKVMEEMPRAPHEVFEDIPVALSDLVMACLAKRAADRPASALEVHDRLEAIS